MNLKDGAGKVPIWTGGETPWLLVDWPTIETFREMWKRTPPDLVERYWRILCSRRDGAKLSEAGAVFGLTKERVRQIEARFQRSMREHHQGPA